jgi:MFS transporter, PAT family, beta-lactamase induction signal transducer AmpG
MLLIIMRPPMLPKSDFWSRMFSTRMLAMLFLGYCAGLPLLLTGSTLQAWMSDAQIDIKDIGLFSLVGLPYTLKFLWAPFLDRFHFFPGRRRGWMWVFQIGAVVSLVVMSKIKPENQLVALSLVSFLVAFFSASQDIVIDAYRREILSQDELGLGSALYTNGYRLAMLLSGALALTLADRMAWENVYLLMAGFMALSLPITFLVPKEKILLDVPKTIKEAVIGPFVDFLKQPQAWMILAFILLYKMGDTMASHLTTPFILAKGYTKTDIAAVAKTFGMIATIGGGLMGGIFILRLGIVKSLWVFGFLQAFSTLGFCVLDVTEPSLLMLSMVIGFENLCSGLGTSAYAAFMASKTNVKYSATQLALLTSLMGVPRVFAAAPTGFLQTEIGWVGFFIFCTMVAIPGMLLIPKLKDQSR